MRQLLDADGERQRVQAGAPVLPWNQDPHEPGGGGGLDRLVGETVVPIDLRREGLDDILRQLPNGVAKARVLGRKFEVQVKRYLE